MKKAFISAMILIVSAQSFSQLASDTNHLIKADYLKKSKIQKTIAWVVACKGTVVITLGILIKSSRNPDGLDHLLGNLFIIIGGIEMLPSIPLFIAAEKNKRKAMDATISFKMETAPIIQKNSFVQTSFPALSFKIDLK